jgi:hypothetical protein
MTDLRNHPLEAEVDLEDGRVIRVLGAWAVQWRHDEPGIRDAIRKDVKELVDRRATT